MPTVKAYNFRARKLSKISAIFFLLPASASTPCSAEWTESNKTNTFTLYIDDTTIQIKGDTTFVWVMYDFSKPQPEGYQSVKALLEFKCALNRYRFRMFTAFESPMGEGEAGQPKSATTWDIPISNSPLQSISKRICKN